MRNGPYRIRGSKKKPAPSRLSKTSETTSPTYVCANVDAAERLTDTLACSSRATFCVCRRSRSSFCRTSLSWTRSLSRRSLRRTSSNTSRACNSSSRSSSSITSASDFSSVLPTIACRIGSTSTSKSNKSLSSTCVLMSIPRGCGTKMGEGGRSSLRTLTVEIVSISIGRSVISSSRHSTTGSCATSDWPVPNLSPRCRPLANVGARPDPPGEVVRSSCKAAAGNTCAAYVFPRTTRLSLLTVHTSGVTPMSCTSLPASRPDDVLHRSSWRCRCALSLSLSLSLSLPLSLSRSLARSRYDLPAHVCGLRSATHVCVCIFVLLFARLLARLRVRLSSRASVRARGPMPRRGHGRDRYHMMLIAMRPSAPIRGSRNLLRLRTACGCDANE